MIEFIVKNWGMVSVILFLIMSEIMDWVPSLKASSISKVIYNLLKGEAQKAKPEVDKLLHSSEK
jgi:hypothetical protein